MDNITDLNQADQGIRLKKLMKFLRMNQTEFAKSLGMTQPNISRMVTGESKLSMELLNRITAVHKEINLHWLLTGDGEMLLDESEKNIVSEPPPSSIGKSKGRLEDLEERVKRLEELVKPFLKDKG